MKLHLPVSLLTGVICAMSVGTVCADTVTPTIVADSAALTASQGGSVAVDSSITIADDAKVQSSVYVRNGELTIGSEGGSATKFELKPSGSDITAFSVAGKDAVMTIVNTTYTEKDGTMKHVGGSDGSGTLNFIGSTMTGNNSELFTIGVMDGNGPDRTTDSSTESGLYEGSYHRADGTAGNFGAGIVNVSGGSTFNASFRHVQMGEGTLNITDSAVVFGNETGGSEYYKGFKTTMGVGEGTTSTINVNEGGSLNIYASKYTDAEGKTYLGGFSTNYSDGSTANINVDGGTFAVGNPEDANPSKYLSGRSGTSYIGYSFDSESSSKTTPKNTTTNINITNGGSAEFNQQATLFGYEGMSENGSSVNIVVGAAGEESVSSLQVNSKDVSMHDGVTLDNYGKVTVNTTYEYQTYEGGVDIPKNSTSISGAVVNNHAGAEIEIENGLEIDSTSMVNNEGSLSAEAMEVSGEASVKNSGDITIAPGEFLEILGSAKVENSGSISGSTWLRGDAALTLLDGGRLDTLFVGENAVVEVDGQVDMYGKLANFKENDAEIVFTLGSGIDMHGQKVILGNITIVLSLDGSVDDNTQVAGQYLFTNYAETDTTINSDTTVVLRGSDGSESLRTLGTIPEPTTATLSLLALAALAARRRRK